jgi:hypothetical protein
MDAFADYQQRDRDANQHPKVGPLRATPRLRLPGTGPGGAGPGGQIAARKSDAAPARAVPPAPGQYPRTHRAASGTHVRSASPMYSLSGLISRLSACCSITCAVHPAILETENTGVNRSVGMPR